MAGSNDNGGSDRRRFLGNSMLAAGAMALAPLATKAAAPAAPATPPAAPGGGRPPGDRVLGTPLPAGQRQQPQLKELKGPITPFTDGRITVLNQPAR